MKKILFFALFSILSASVFAAGEFPNVFLTNGKFNGIIVVGNNGSSSDVIAQSNLVWFFNSLSKESLQGKTKLSSEVNDLNQNIISIGSPCVNSISSRILFPDPGSLKNYHYCEKERQSLVKLYGGGRIYHHMVIVGANDSETRKIVEDIINDRIFVKFEPTTTDGIKPSESYIEPKKDEEQGIMEPKMNAEAETENIVEVNKRISAENIEENKKQEDKKEINESVNESTNAAGNKEKGDNIIKKIIDWLFSLFKK